ncbi:MAG: putative cobalamin biosynthesis protein CobD [Archaeoglobus fulgidus]|uniref:Probable cobalamin biosynthesis protein CobD n=1 Tax=Archaeoglobus fulgidus TaxID=2234 RepID=A0A101DC01_ARCFL|nr:adenosylcobinamide-phosphate synthase CbiB [Archaeoglobus fulgidus]KUJ92778.1 MAG: putative cobalamin biosynthesis protein CobD [Archaeoglobus fulgidus]KUK06106.1 MAG: putative cobalamin biosynthesis protein CobD [Archaeoglobus fulgidus]
MGIEVVVLLTSLMLDAAVGEPPALLHPVVWYGKLISLLERAKFRKMLVEIFYGAFCCLIVITFALILSLLPFPYPLNFLWAVYLLFSSISVKSMVNHARVCVESGVDRKAVQMIVSRNTEELSEEQLCSAVIESVAENYVDGVVAPLFYFSIFGVAGAVVYRAVNTCDAMVGYRKGRYEAFGKFAARLDDILNYIPARLSLLFFELLKRGAFSYGLKRNVKLNGCAIAAMSYLLGVKLEKPGYYSLPGIEPSAADIERAIKAFVRLTVIAVIFTTIAVSIRIVLLTKLHF